MSSEFKQLNTSNDRFSSTGVSDVEFSYLEPEFDCFLSGNAGDIIPIGCFEILPNQTTSISLQSIIRQTTLLRPTMGEMIADINFFFVPNRIVNEHWPAVMKDNIYDTWASRDVLLASLMPDVVSDTTVTVPVGSIADYYGFSTQEPLSRVMLRACHDMKFRGYYCIYNYFYRDQNYEPPIPFSRLNIFNGFFEPVGTQITFNSVSNVSVNIPAGTAGDGSAGAGSIVNGIYGDGSISTGVITIPPRTVVASALSYPLKAYKYHDYFTSVLPAPQKGPAVAIPLLGSNVPVDFDFSGRPWLSVNPLILASRTGGTLGDWKPLYRHSSDNYSGNSDAGTVAFGNYTGTPDVVSDSHMIGMNLVGNVDLSSGNAGVNVSDLRNAVAVQHVYEELARCGSRYEEYLMSFFGVKNNDEMKRVPQHIGKITRALKLWQTAQTVDDSNGSLGDLGGFGYTFETGSMGAPFTAVEHGYIHVLLTIRQVNIYPSYLSQDNFRRSFFDYYQKDLANLSEQPLYIRELNPYAPNPLSVYGYQEAWASYRYYPSRVAGLMRPGSKDNVSVWNYADLFDNTITIANSSYLKSNAEEVLNRTIVAQSSTGTTPERPNIIHQFYIQIHYKLGLNLPMPTYSLPGLDVV